MLTLNFIPFPEIRTTRLLLRQQTDNDVEDFFYMRSNPRLMQYIPRPLHQSSNDTLQHIRLLNDNITAGNSINWVITLQENPGSVIGTIGYVRIQKENFRGEVGYILNDHFHGKGIMHEALEAVLDYGFNGMQLHSAEAVIDPANTASAKVLEKSGFKQEGFFREDCFYNGVFLDSAMYGLLDRDWRALKQSVL